MWFHTSVEPVILNIETTFNNPRILKGYLKEIFISKFKIDANYNNTLPISNTYRLKKVVVMSENKLEFKKFDFEKYFPGRKIRY